MKNEKEKVDDDALLLYSGVETIEMRNAAPVSPAVVSALPASALHRTAPHHTFCLVTPALLSDAVSSVAKD